MIRQLWYMRILEGDQLWLRVPEHVHWPWSRPVVSRGFITTITQHAGNAVQHLQVWP